MFYRIYSVGMNRYEVRIVGMSRSGNHAVINWILSQANGRTCFLNCCEPGCNPFETARPLDDGRRIVVDYRPFDAAAERRGEHSRKDLLVHSYEDCFLGGVASNLFEQRHDDWLGPSLERIDVLILRDPYNLFASRIRGGIGAVSDRVAVRIWKQHAREFLGIRRYLGPRRVAVNYNRWADEKQYRRRIATDLHLEFTDAGRQHVPATGNGSSFDGVRYDGRADAMPTLDRWRHFKGNARYAALFDEEMRELSQRIFGDLAGAPDVTHSRCNAYKCA